MEHSVLIKMQFLKLIKIKDHSVHCFRIYWINLAPSRNITKKMIWYLQEKKSFGYNLFKLLCFVDTISKGWIRKKNSDKIFVCYHIFYKIWWNYALIWIHLHQILTKWDIKQNWIAEFCLGLAFLFLTLYMGSIRFHSCVPT